MFRLLALLCVHGSCIFLSFFVCLCKSAENQGPIEAAAGVVNMS